ncbi:ATP-binding protein [Minwuia sp.]|uniref:ATP-binding protein n=1 Tax=Minwuia sp. TaxID=2493630 RepID=UPI003A8DCDFF
MTAGLFLACGLAMSAVLAFLVLDDLRYRTTLESARSYSAMLTVVRDYYTAVVVGGARKSETPISANYHQIEGAIPPPATMTIELGVWMNDTIKPGSFRFYSNYPFRTRDDGGPRNSFEIEALDILVDKRADRFVQMREDQGSGRSVLSLAQPVSMGKGCVSCHNAHPDSPRTDWKVGDIRGVQVISIGLPPLLPSFSDLINRENGILIPAALLVIGLVAVALLLLALMQRLRRTLDLADQRNRQLSRARAVAEHAAETKSRIMANVSHELRTPMNAIVGFSEMMNAEIFGPINNRKYREYSASIHVSAEQLMNIIENMIGMAELDAGKKILQRETVDSLVEIRRAIGLFAPEAEEDGVSLWIDETADWPLLAFDRRAFRQIIGNLVSNAVRHAGPGSTARVSTVMDRDQLRIIISDDGVGIPRHELKRILQPFEGVADPAFANAKGIGLGLTMARELAAMHGGSIRIDTVPGNGVSVTVILPQDCVVGVPQRDSGEASAVPEASPADGRGYDLPARPMDF